MSQAVFNIQGAYAGMCVADLDIALVWYEKLIGRPAADKPIPGMVQWRNLGGAGLQLWQDDTNAGHSVMTIVTPDLDAEVTRLAALDIAAVNAASGPFGRIAQLFDPDGNRIALAEPPPGFAG